jgi:hypothetical protein
MAGHSVKIDRQIIQLKRELDREGFRPSWHNPLLDRIETQPIYDAPFLYEASEHGVKLYVCNIPVFDTPEDWFTMDFDIVWGELSFQQGSQVIGFTIVFADTEILRPFCLHLCELAKPDVLDSLNNVLVYYEFVAGDVLQDYLVTAVEPYYFGLTMENDVNVYLIFRCELRRPGEALLILRKLRSRYEKLQAEAVRRGR